MLDLERFQKSFGSQVQGIVGDDLERNSISADDVAYISDELGNMLRLQDVERLQPT